MRLGTGLLVLVLAGVGLGWLHQASYAPHVEARITERASSALGMTVHPVEILVDGRDITVVGLADGPADRNRIIAAMDAVDGRRRVNDALEVLPVIEPFSMRLSWDGTVLRGDGYAPTLAVAQGISALGEMNVTLAAGAPSGWGAAIAAIAAALAPLENGQAEVAGQAITLQGTARTPVEGQAVEAALAAMPPGFDVENRVAYIDDGTPPAYQVIYRVDRGVRVEGKLPLGTDTAMIAQALDLPHVDDGASVALIGEAGAVDPALSVLAGWLRDFEGFTMDVQPGGSRVELRVGQGADIAVLEPALRADLDPLGTRFTIVMAPPEGSDGDTRSNLITGETEQLSGGFWLPVATFDATPETCAAETRSALSAHRIGFLSGSARLDARARRSVNMLASVMRSCIDALGLRAEVGGHTDNTGTDEGNLALSQARAEAVVAALVARGIPASALEARGYGASEPVADNETEEGRAANRRTEVTWSGA